MKGDETMKVKLTNGQTGRLIGELWSASENDPTPLWYKILLDTGEQIMIPCYQAWVII